MPYTIHTAKAKIREGLSGKYHDIDVFSDGAKNEIKEAKDVAINDIQAQSERITQFKANGAVLNTETANMISTEFDVDTAYTAGTYVRKSTTSNGVTTAKLYRLTANHAAGTSWQNTSKVEVKISNEVTDLKSTVDGVKDVFYSYQYTPGELNWRLGGYDQSTGKENVGMKTRICTDIFTPGEDGYLFVKKADNADIAFWIIAYDENGKPTLVKGNNGNTYEGYNIRKKYSITVRYVPDKTMANKDVNTLASLITVICKTTKFHEKINRPSIKPHGTAGQYLQSLGDGNTVWADALTPTTEEVTTAVENWMDDHPETRVLIEDYSLSYEKLAKGTLAYVTPEMFGAVGDGETDDSSAVQSAINYAYENHLAFMGTGATYAVASPVSLVTRETYANKIVMDFNGSTLKAIMDNMQEVVIINSDTGLDTPGKYPKYIRQLNIDGNRCAAYGVHDIFGRSIYIKDIKIYDVTDTCFRVETNTFNGDGSCAGGGLFIDGMVLDNDKAPFVNVTGLYIPITDAKLSNIKMRNIKTGIALYGGSTYLYNVHPYLFNPATFSGSICFDIHAPDQHFMLCYADTYEIGWNIESDSIYLTDCHIYHNMNAYPVTAAIPEIFHFSSLNLTYTLFIYSFNTSTAPYYRATGNKVKFSNLEATNLTHPHFYNLRQVMKISTSDGMDLLDGLPVVSGYSKNVDLDWYYRGTELQPTDDLDTITTVGRYYTKSTDHLPINTPITNANYELRVEHVTFPENYRKRQTIIDQNGETYIRTCGNSVPPVWSEWKNRFSVFKDYGGTAIYQTDDIDLLYDVGRYYTTDISKLPIHSPITGVNYELRVEYVTFDFSRRRKQIITDQDGVVYSRTCNNSNPAVWSAWSRKSAKNELKLLSGHTTISFTASNTVVSKEISFGNDHFDVVPIIMLTPQWDSTSTNYTQSSFIVASKSTTGFTIRGIIQTGTSFDAQIDWLAIAPESLEMS